MLTWKSLMIWMNFCGQPYHASTGQRTSLLTVSNIYWPWSGWWIWSTNPGSFLCIYLEPVSLRKACWLCCTLGGIRTGLLVDMLLTQWCTYSGWLWQESSQWWKGDDPVVSTVGFAAFIFVESYNQGILEIFWHLLLFPDATEDIMEDIIYFWACSFVISAGIPSFPGA